MSILQMEERSYVLAKLIAKCIDQSDTEGLNYYYQEYMKVLEEIVKAEKLWQSQ